MEIIKKLKTDKKFLFLTIGFVALTFLIPYITLPVLFLWWFYKKSKLSKRAKTITTGGVGVLFAVLAIWSGISYANDAEPHLTVTEPAKVSTLKASKITIKGTYEPADRKVWINGKEIASSNGTFETKYSLEEGENKIDVSAGNWKRAYVYLTATRELTDAEKEARITPTATPTPTEKPKSESESKEQPKKQNEQKKTESKPVAKPQSKEQIIEEKVKAIMKGKTNMDKDRLREVRITEQVDGGYGVLVFINADDNLSEDYIKKGIWGDMADTYKALFKEDIGVTRATLFAHFPMTDKYGKTSDTMVLKTSLEKEEAQKVNWDADEASLHLSILPNVWTTEKSLFR